MSETSTFDRVLFSTGKDDWETPPDLFSTLDAEFHFTLDAAANPRTAKCEFFYGPGSPIQENALLIDWPTHDRIWCNPPYSRGMQRHFIRKTAECGQRGGLAVMLLPARTDTAAFHRYIWDCINHRPILGVEVRFLPGRLKFVGAKAAAPFPSMIVVFRGA